MRGVGVLLAISANDPPSGKVRPDGDWNAGDLKDVHRNGIQLMY